MKERPVNLTAAEVRGILDGTLTSFRRPIHAPCGEGWRPAGVMVRTHADLADPAFRWERSGSMATEWVEDRCPFGKPGDRLWVRETWGSPGPQVAAYRADGKRYGICPDGAGGRLFIDHESLFMADSGPLLPSGWGNWRPSIHMPRWASRLSLEVTEVRAQRLQDISEEDARAEGLPLNWVGPLDGNKAANTRGWTPQDGWLTPVGYQHCIDHPGDDCAEGGTIGGKPAFVFSAKEALQLWWDHINGERPGANWESNPWVWAVSFKRRQIPVSDLFAEIGESFPKVVVV